MQFPAYIQKAIDLGLLSSDGVKVVYCNDNTISRAVDVARIVDKLQPTSIQEREDTIAQEAIVLSRLLAAPSSLARELWAELRTGFGVGYGQLIPQSLWSDQSFRAIANEIDLTFIGERSSQVLSRESLIAGYTGLSDGSRSISIVDFTKTIALLSDPSTLARYGDEGSEWDTALDILKQVRVRALCLETLHVVKQNIKADVKLEEILEYLQKMAMEGIGMMRGNIGNQGQSVNLVDAIIGDPGSQRKNWIDRLSLLSASEQPASTGIFAFDLDIQCGVAHPRLNKGSGGRLMTICARPGIGKSTLACQIAASLSSQGMTVGFISAELDYTAIEARILASLSRKVVQNGNFHWTGTQEKVGYVTVNELQNPSIKHKYQLANVLANIVNGLQECGGKFLIEAPWGACANAVVNSMRAMKAKNPELRAVFLDHFHCLARHKNAARDTPTMLEERANMLMTASKELDIDLFVCAQMNQSYLKLSQSNVSKNPTIKPELDWIRGTDVLGHLSHAVWMVLKHQTQEEQPSGRKIEIWHTKAREGQSFWDDSMGEGHMVTVQGTVDMSLIQIDYPTSSLKSDDTMQRTEITRSRRIM